MAFKALVFMLACLLLVSLKATAFQEEMVYGGQPPLKPPCDHATAPAQSSPANATSPTTSATPPTSTPVYPTPQAPQTPSSAPTTTPVYPTPQAPSHAPTSAPTYSTPPTVVPGVPTNRNHLRYCVPECQRRCIMLRDQHKILRKIRPCVHVCTLCCEKNKSLCVPSAQSTCPIWDNVTYHGGIRNCP